MNLSRDTAATALSGFLWYGRESSRDACPEYPCRGGAVLLQSLLRSLADSGYECDALVDERLDLKQTAGGQRIHRFSSGLRGRWTAERRLLQLATPQPPACSASVRCRRCFVVRDGFRSSYRIAISSRPQALRVTRTVNAGRQGSGRPGFDRVTRTHTNTWCRRRPWPIYSSSGWARPRRIRIHPFLPEPPSPNIKPPNDQRPCHLFPVADIRLLLRCNGRTAQEPSGTDSSLGTAHRQGLFPSLCLTLARHNFTELCDWIDAQSQLYGLQVKNLGYVSRDEIDQLYRSCRGLVFPSQYESFGMPLLEARRRG